MTSANDVIEVRDLTRSYGKTQVLKGINLQVERGTMLALVGPNGAGKTTTIRILSTLLGFDGGTVMVDGHDVRAAADKVRAVRHPAGGGAAGGVAVPPPYFQLRGRSMTGRNGRRAQMVNRCL